MSLPRDADPSAYGSTINGQIAQLSTISPSVLESVPQRIDFIFDNRDTAGGPEVHIDNLVFTITQATPGSTVSYNIHGGSIVCENGLHAWWSNPYGNEWHGDDSGVEIYLFDGVNQIGPRFCFPYKASGKGGNGF